MADGMYFDRDGKEIESTLEWARKYEDAEYRIVAIDSDGAPDGVMVSTIWEGINKAFMDGFGEGAHRDTFDTAWLTNGVIYASERTSSEEEAREKHAEFTRLYLGREPRPGDGFKQMAVEEFRKRDEKAPRKQSSE